MSCEHASHKIPAEYQSLFAAHHELLETHRGYDIGALELAEKLQPLADFSLFGCTSRLLVELNRSLHHPRLFSSLTQPLASDKKREILANYYFPYRQQIEQYIQHALNKTQTVIHISVHSFTPKLDEVTRNCDIGLLYDSKRKNERRFSQHWKQHLKQLNSELIIRFNYPYAGKADGFTSYLRKKFSENQYIGIELEVNQKLPLTQGKAWEDLQSTLYQSIELLKKYYRINASCIRRNSEQRQRQSNDE